MYVSAEKIESEAQFNIQSWPLTKDFLLNITDCRFHREVGGGDGGGTTSQARDCLRIHSVTVSWISGGLKSRPISAPGQQLGSK